MVTFMAGDKVFSRHHGHGVVEGTYDDGRYRILCDFDGSKFSYSMDGKYFLDGAFYDEEAVLLGEVDVRS